LKSGQVDLEISLAAPLSDAVHTGMEVCKMGLELCRLVE